MDETEMSATEWETELKLAMREIQRGEYKRRQALSKRNASPWVV